MSHQYSKPSVFLCCLHPPRMHTSPIHAICTAHLRLICYSDNICSAAQIMKLLITLLFHSPVTSCLLSPNILLSSLFSNTRTLCSSLNSADQVSHPCQWEAVVQSCSTLTCIPLVSRT